MARDDPNIGRVLKNTYVIDRPLGRGGMGVVYEAHHRKIARRFAVKLLLAGEDAPNGRIIQAAGGKFASDMVYSNTGVDLGIDLSAEDLLDAADTVLDMSDAAPKTTFWR